MSRDEEREPAVDRFATVKDWYRKLSWLAIFVGLLIMANAEIGFPPDKFPWKPKPPISVSRMQYVTAFAIGLPGATWAVVRAIRRDQKTPWGDWDE